MTSESDFQAKLDAEPGNHTVRLIFADWLQDRSDPRADGFRALGKNRLLPHFSQSSGLWVFWNAGAYPNEVHLGWDDNYYLPGDWFAAAFNKNLRFIRMAYRDFMEDAAAIAFATLPPERQAELLSGKAVPV